MADEHGGFEEVRDSVDGHSMAGLLRYCLPYWLRLTVGMAAAMTTRASRLVPPIVVAAAINRVVTGSGEPGLLTWIGLLPAGEISGRAARLGFLRQLVVIAALAYVVRSVTRFASRYLFQSTAQKVQRDLRNDTYDHMQRLSLSFFANHQTGAMMSVLNQDINRLEQFLNTEIRQGIRVLATVGGIAVVMFLYSPKLALIALAPVPVIGLASGKFLTWIEPKYRAIRETVSRLNSRLENNLGGARVIKTFNRYDFELDRVAAQSEQYHDEKIGAIRMRRAFFSSLRLVTGIVFVAILWVAGSDFIVGRDVALGAGGIALFFMLLRRLYAPMRRVGKTANKYQLAKSSAERVFGILGHDPDMTTPEDPYVPGESDRDEYVAASAADDEVAAGGVDDTTDPNADPVTGTVTFDDVTFGYDGGEIVLDGIDLDVQPGETVGLAGTTGAGKSTLLKLLPRFYDVDSGEVRVDGVPVEEWDLTALREHVGIVEQTPYMFSGSAEENIAYGDLSALSGDGVDERVVEAAKAAEAHEFIVDLPEGYDTEIGERGVKLSGGQRQRLAIARALLNDPAIVVLDEATSDVDTETEEQIQESLDRLTADRTAFVIAHRLSTLRDADTIVVMEDGQIGERGSHEELVDAGGQYADLWATQSGAEDLDAEVVFADDD